MIFSWRYLNVDVSVDDVCFAFEIFNVQEIELQLIMLFMGTYEYTFVYILFLLKPNLCYGNNRITSRYLNISLK